MASTSDPGITAFVRYLTLGEDRRDTNPRVRDLIPDAPRVIFDTGRREMYSYGMHFPLARYVPAKRGRGAQWLINGDTWPRRGFSMTWRHQSETRAAIETAIADAAKRGQLVSSLIVPFTALDGAGIDRDSIRAIHVREDRREPFRNTATIPARFVSVPLPNRALVENESRARDPHGSAIMRTDTLASSLTLHVSTESLETGAASTSTTTAPLTRNVVYRGYDYSMPVTVDCHMCGATGQIANDPHGYRGGTAAGTSDCARCDGTGLVVRHGANVDYDPPKVTYWHGGSRELTVENVDGDTALVSWSTDRHWLGDSLFMATRIDTRRVPCPNHAGTRAPDSPNVWCDHCGQIVSEVATTTTRGDGSVRIVAPDRAPLMTITTRRRMRFLSSFDYQERAPLYFLAALPRKSRAVTVDMAVDDLAPRAVHAAYARGLAVKRQGDIFAIPTVLTDADVYARAVRRTRLYMWQRPGASKPRPGEVGYRRPLSPAAAHARTAMIRRDTLAAIRADMAADRRPDTPAGFRRDKRHELAKLRAAMDRHAARIAAGDDVCQCTSNYNNPGTTCPSCGLSQWWHSYSAANAATALARETREYASVLARPRVRAKGYASTMAPHAKYGKCYSRALTAYRAAVDAANVRYSPHVPVSEYADTLAIFGTGHTASEVAVCRGGVTYIRGIFRHEPAIAGERRDRDHAAQKLDGARWYLAVRNTVPRQ
jgi:hypothetical protein